MSAPSLWMMASPLNPLGSLILGGTSPLLQPCPRTIQCSLLCMTYPHGLIFPPPPPPHRLVPKSIRQSPYTSIPGTTKLLRKPICKLSEPKLSHPVLHLERPFVEKAFILSPSTFGYQIVANLYKKFACTI